MADQTIVIEVVSEFKDNASSGISRVKNATDQTSSSAERLNGSMNKLKRQIASATGVGSGSGVGGTSTGVLQKLKAINAEARRLNSGGGSFLSKVRNFGQAIKNIGSGGNGNVLRTLGGYTKKGLTIPIKILDKATSPLRRLYRGLTSFRGIVTGMAANWAFQKGVLNPIKQADQLTNAKTFFAMKFGGQRQANAFMKDVYAFDKKSPYDTGQIIQVAKTMLGYGWGRKNVLRDLGTIEDAAAAHGAGQEGVAGIMRQLAQTRMRLKPSQEDINVLNSYGVDAWKYIAQGLGLKGNAAGKAKAREMVQAKGSNVLSGEEATNLILKGLRKDFNGAAQKQVEKTAGGMFDKISGELNTKLVVPWGQGLQKGAIKGLKVIDNWINDHEGSVDKFGQKLKKVSQTASVTLAKTATKIVNRLSKTVGSKKFKKADFAGKVNMVETAVFGKDGIQKAAAQFGEYSAKYGGKIGLGIAKGFAQGIMSLIKDMLTVLPGGKKPSPTAKGSAFTLGVLGATGIIKAGLGIPALKLGLKGMGKLTKSSASWIKDYANFSKNLEENMTRYGSFRKYHRAQKAARVEKAAEESRAVKTLRGSKYDKAHWNGETVVKGSREATPVRATKFRRLTRGSSVVEDAGGVAREGRMSRILARFRTAKVGMEEGKTLFGVAKGAGSVSKFASVARGVGKIATPLAVAGSLLSVAMAKNKTKAAFSEGGGWAGMFAGSKIGAGLGSFAGPIGTLVGGLGGGAIGMFAGSKLGKGLSNAILGKTKKAADPLSMLLFGKGKGSGFKAIWSAIKKGRAADKGSKGSGKNLKSAGKDAKSAGKSAKSAGKNFKSAGKSAKSGSKGFKSAGKAAKSGSKGFKSAGKAAKSAGKSFKSAGKSAKSGSKGFKSAGKAARSGAKGFKSAGKSAKSAGRGFKSAGKAAKSGSKGFKTAGKNAKSAGTKFKSAGNNAKSAGSKMKGAASKVQSLGTKATGAGSKLTAMGSKASAAASNLSKFSSAVSSIASAASGLASKISSIHIPSSIGKGHARGTSSAAPGLKLVGEEGPELLQFRGGERVYTAAQTRHMLRRAGNRKTTTASGVHVNVGNITINATGDAAGFEALIPQLSNRIAHEVAREAGRIYQNTPTRSA